MPGYTYGDYVYYDNMRDALKEQHNHLILNHKKKSNLTTLMELMDVTFS